MFINLIKIFFFSFKNGNVKMKVAEVAIGGVL